MHIPPGGPPRGWGGVGTTTAQATQGRWKPGTRGSSRTRPGAAGRRTSPRATSRLRWVVPTERTTERCAPPGVPGRAQEGWYRGSRRLSPLRAGCGARCAGRRRASRRRQEPKGVHHVRSVRRVGFAAGTAPNTQPDSGRTAGPTRLPRPSRPARSPSAAPARAISRPSPSAPACKGAASSPTRTSPATKSSR